MKRLLTLLLLLACLSAEAQSIFTNPTWPDWTDFTGVTFPTTGISDTYYTLYKDAVADLGCDPTGASDCAAILNTAWAACPSGQYIRLPSGTYRCDSVINPDFSDETALIGAGMGKTILKPTTSNKYVIDSGTQESPRPAATIAVTGGATAGSTSVTVAAVNNSFPVGRMMRIEQVSPNYIHSLIALTNPSSTMVYVTATNATSITFQPSLPFTFVNATYAVSYPTHLQVGTWVEHLTIDLTGTTDSGIYFEQGIDCGARDVEISHTHARNIVFDIAMNFEVSHCYFHDADFTGGNANHESICLTENCCYGQVFDNICSSGGYPEIVLGDGAPSNVGNVIAYNFATNDANVLTSFSDNHGPGSDLNLFEGNVGKNFSSDGYFGGSARTTLLRNFFRADYASASTNGGFAIQARARTTTECSRP